MAERTVSAIGGSCEEFHIIFLIVSKDWMSANVSDLEVAISLPAGLPI